MKVSLKGRPLNLTSMNAAIYKQLATHSLKDKYFYEEFEKVVLDDLLASDMDKRYSNGAS